MIRTGLSSSLRSIVVRQLGPSTTASTSSPLVRPFSSSPSSRQDGLFPTHPKQEFYDGAQLLKEAGVGSIAPPPGADRVGGPAPGQLSGPDGELDSSNPAANDGPQTAGSPANPTADASAPAPSDVTAGLGLGSPDSPPVIDSFYPTPSSGAHSFTSADSSSSVAPSSPPPFEFTPSSPPMQPSAHLLQTAQLRERLNEARRDLPSAVTAAEWQFLKGPPSEMRVIRYSLMCTKNNTQGTLSWAYKPENRGKFDHYNAKLRGISQYSGGRLGFKGAASGGAEAGHQVVVAMFKKVEEENKRELEKKAKKNAELGLPAQTGYLRDTVGVHVRLNINGFGQGREAFFKALKSEEGSLIRQLTIAISDHTPIKIVGGRPPLVRRV